MNERDIEQELKLSLLKDLDAFYSESCYSDSTLVDGKLTINELYLNKTSVVKVIEVNLITKFYVNEDGLIITTIIE